MPFEIDPRRIDFIDVWIDEFHFLRRLGTGGFASVWLADECGPNRDIIRSVAIKVFLDDFSDRDSFQRTFNDFILDLKMLADLAPNNPIVHYFGYRIKEIVLSEDGSAATMSSRPPSDESTAEVLTAFLLIMEYADGGALDSTFRDEVVLHGDHGYLNYFLDISVGLKAAHDADIVHRDIKPGNLLWFRKLNLAKVVDFGIAKHINEIHPSPRYLIGSLPYMSPEAFLLEAPAKPPRDIYALGCTFYEIMTGNLAFSLSTVTTGKPDARDQSSLIAQYHALHERGERPEAKVAQPSLVSFQLNQLITKMMAVDPDERPTIEEVINALTEEKNRLIPDDDFDATRTDVPAPNEPMHLSSFNVCPNFRMKLLREVLYFIFINMRIKAPNKYSTLFAHLDRTLKDTYSIYEVFGSYDYVIRTWAPVNRVKISELCKNITDDVLDSEHGALHVLACENVDYLGANSGPMPEKNNVVPILTKLSEHQENCTDDSANWLKSNRIFVRPLRRRKNDITCFCRISNARNVSESERESRWAVLKAAVEDSAIDVKRHEISMYMRAYQPVAKFPNETCDYLIKYVARSYGDVVQIPVLILDELAKYLFFTDTLLSSGRYYVQSDRVLPS